MRRVVVTGMGAITPIGNTVDEMWKSLKAGRVGIGTLDRFDVSEYPVKLAAQVKGFDPLKTMEYKEAKRMELFCQYAVAAAAEAVARCGAGP